MSESHMEMSIFSSSQRVSRTRRDFTCQMYYVHHGIALFILESRRAMLLPSGEQVTITFICNVAVLTEAQGPIGQIAAEFSFINGASRVIMIDSNWGLGYVKSQIPKG